METPTGPPGSGNRSTRSHRQLTGWLAVAAQFVAIIGIVVSPGDPALVPAAVRWAGILLIAVGGVTMVVAFLNLGSALTPTPVPVVGAGLRTTGLYARIRHPIYTGLLLLAGGLVLRSPGLWPALWFVLLAAILTAKAIWEEHMLAEAYPDYREYRRHTGRFLPRLRPIR